MVAIEFGWCSRLEGSTKEGSIEEALRGTTMGVWNVGS